MSLLGVDVPGEDKLRFAVACCVLGFVSWKVWKKVISYVLLPAQLVFRFRQSTLEATTTEFLHRYSQVAKRVTIKSSSGDVALDGVEIVGDQRTNKYLVMMNANGVCYEDILDETYEYARLVGCKALVFNYRGVGRSSGWPNASSDLVMDGITVINWLIQERKVNDSDILIHGHSIGGAVGGIALAELGLKCSIVADRTFGNLLDIVDRICGTVGMIDTSIIGAIIMGNVSSVLGLVYLLGFADSCLPTPSVLTPICWLLTSVTAQAVLKTLAPDEHWPFTAGDDEDKGAMFSRLVRYSISGLIGIIPFAMASTVNILSFTCVSGLVEVMFSGACFGFMLGMKGHLKAIARGIVRFLGWDMNTGKMWNNLVGRKAILFHDWDSMIPTALNIVQVDETFKLQNTSTLSSVSPSPQITSIIQLLKPCQPAHMYPLMEMQREKLLVIEFARTALNI